MANPQGHIGELWGWLIGLHNPSWLVQKGQSKCCVAVCRINVDDGGDGVATWFLIGQGCNMVPDWPELHHDY